jgi:hypothetical protein
LKISCQEKVFLSKFQFYFFPKIRNFNVGGFVNQLIKEKALGLMKQYFSGVALRPDPDTGQDGGKQAWVQIP